jgi:hypothetical protein
MCAAFEFKGTFRKPGHLVNGVHESKIVSHVWAGFARAEILPWWKRQGALLLDIPATRFAERSDLTHQLIWDEINPDLVLRGLLDLRTTNPLIKVVTRASTPAELERFQHPRMPVLQPPLFAIQNFEGYPTEPDLFKDC